MARRCFLLRGRSVESVAPRAPFDYFNFTNSKTKIAHTPTVSGNCASWASCSGPPLGSAYVSRNIAMAVRTPRVSLDFQFIVGLPRVSPLCRRRAAPVSADEYTPAEFQMPEKCGRLRPPIPAPVTGDLHLSLACLKEEMKSVCPRCAQNMDGVQPGLGQDRPVGDRKLGRAQPVSVTALRVDVQFGRNLQFLQGLKVQ